MMLLTFLPTNYSKASGKDSPFSEEPTMMVNLVEVKSDEQSCNVMFSRNNQRSILNLIKT